MSGLGSITKVPRVTLVAIVRVYQRTLSPLIPFHCRFRPTCSEYFIEAVTKRGVLRGVALGVWRILRCQPFSKGGMDAVPPVGKWKPDE